MNSQSDILKIKSELNVQLPNSYKNFLSERGNDIAFGHPIFGIPATLELNSVLGATYLLRLSRPELLDYVVIRIVDERALCLDLKNGTLVDSPLVEINLNNSEPPTKVHNSFRGYISQSDQSKKEVEYGINRLRNLFRNREIKFYDHIDDSKIPFKARDWRIHKCCVHDLVVGLAAIRYNEKFNGIEVDAFLTTDHPDYEAGHGVKALMTLILSDAYKNGTGMEVRFTKFDFKSKKRVTDRIPKSLLNCIESLGLKFQHQNEARITHHESINIFSSLLGIQNEVRKRVSELEKINEVTLQGICFLINNRIWTTEQVNWLILNVPRPKGIIFGRDNPEDRLNYAESLSFGRSVVAFAKFKEKIENTIPDELNDVEVYIKGNLFIVSSFRDCEIDWFNDNHNFIASSREEISVLSRPRSKWINIDEQIKTDINSINQAKGRKVILYSNDILNIPDFSSMFNSAKEGIEVDYLIIPFSSDELDEEVITKMKKARTYRA